MTPRQAARAASDALKLKSVRDLCPLLNVPERTLYRYSSTGDGPPLLDLMIRLLAAGRVSVDDIRQAMEAR